VLPAIVLAAGDSTRMGSPKAVLPVPGGPAFVSAIVNTLAAAAISDIVIVTGRDHERVVEALHRDALTLVPRVVRNPDPGRGQLSSLWAGMDAVVSPSAEAIMMTLVDVPLVAPSTVRRVIEEWRRTRAPIVRPARGGRHGHPVIFDRVLFDELRQAPLDAGAKVVVRAHASAIIDVEVDDEGSLTDIDTPDDYAALRRPGGLAP
jgi:molybdenum cofactor cytidylyltransferase